MTSQIVKKLSFIAACRDYFGFKPGQGLMDFKKEIDELTAKDRADLTAMFKTVGYEISTVA